MPWPPEANSAFVSLKQGLASAPALGLPDYSKPFTLFCHEQSGCAPGVLTQMHGEKNRPVAYFSAILDPVAQGLPPSLHAVAATARLVEMSDSLVLRPPLTLLVPHSVETLLLQRNTGHLSSARLTRYELLLLSASYITIKRCSQLNPAILLPLSNDGDPHDCLATVSAVTVPRSDLSDVPLPNSDLVLFTDGSCFRDNQGRLLARYAVVSLSETLEAAPLPSVTSAQVAELVAFTWACFLAEGCSATIYTDSRYAFGVVHDFGTLWQTQGFLTSAGTPIKNGPYNAALLYAVLLPSALAIVKCPGHSMADTDVAKGNAFADASAKHAAAIEPSPDAFLGSLSVSIPPPSLTDLTLLQDSAPETEKESWVAQGCSLHPDSLWRSPTGAFVASFSLYPSLAALLHGVSHVGKEGMVSAVTKTRWWAPHFSSFAARHCAACTICQSHNILAVNNNLQSKPVKVARGSGACLKHRSCIGNLILYKCLSVNNMNLYWLWYVYSLVGLKAFLVARLTHCLLPNVC
ncbi:unnamed protein product [Eretmochelys imbricata]